VQAHAEASVYSGVTLRSMGVYWTLCALLALLYLAGGCCPASATDVRITNFWRHPYSGGNGEVEFDLAWDNSWRSTYPVEPYNWDAVWVFARIRINGGDWAPLKLNTTGHTIPSGFTTTMGLADTGAAHNASTNPAIGMFVYRSSDGFGTATAADMRLQWSYADNGASSGDAVEIRVLGLEMVYVPEGAFYAGDNATSTAAFKQGSGDNDPWYISSESAISVTNAASDGYYYVTDSSGSSDEATGATFSIPDAFPKGYEAFYMMKGELSQGQWVAFFNTLTSTQKTTRDMTAGVHNSNGKASDGLVNRNNVSWVSGDATLPDQGAGATYAGVTMNFLSWNDLTAYLDWSGLRPMSELEFEKAGRGPKAAVSGEYAWGSTSITGATSFTNSGLRSERGQTGSNVAYGNSGGVQGPVRGGSFAYGVNTRISSGAGFYGVFDLSGNNWERPVTVGSSAGRTLQRRYHGNGVLDGSGNSNVTGWPGTNGAGYRGGSWHDSGNVARLSDRYYAALNNGLRYFNYGGRGARSAP
jgi:formylglycine-generating enzyme required for sulfatase activity